MSTLYDRIDPAYRHRVLDAFVEQRARRRSLGFVALVVAAGSAAMLGVAASYDAMEQVWFLLVPLGVFGLVWGVKLKGKGDKMSAALAGSGLSAAEKEQLLRELASHPDFAALRETAKQQSMEMNQAMKPRRRPAA